MASAGIAFGLPSLPLPPGKDAVPTRKVGGDLPVGHGKGASLPPKAEDQAPVAAFRRVIAHAAKAKDFSTEGHPASPTRSAVALAVPAKPIVEPAKNPKKSDSKKTSIAPAAVALPATGNAWAGFVLPPVPSAAHSQTNAALAATGEPTSSMHSAKAPQIATAENSAEKAPPLLPVIPLKSHVVENSAGPSAEVSALPNGAPVQPPIKAITENQAPPQSVEALNAPTPTGRVTEMTAGISSVLGQPLIPGQQGKASPGTAGTGKPSLESVVTELSAMNKGATSAGAPSDATKSRFTDKAGKVNLGDGSSSDTFSVQPLLSTDLASTSSFVPASPLPTGVSGAPAVATPSAPALPMGASGWQAALASRAGGLQPGQSILVRTDPVELGPIQVEATLRAGQGKQGKGLHIQLTVKHSGTAQMLQQGAPVIAQMITTAGAGVPVSVGVAMAHSEQAAFPSFSFSQGSPGQGNPGRGAPGTSAGSPANSSSAAEQKGVESSPVSHIKGFESWI